MQRSEDRASHQYLLKTPTGSDLSCSCSGPCLNWSSTETGSTITRHPRMNYSAAVGKTFETQTSPLTFKNNIRIGNDDFDVCSPTLHLQLSFFRKKNAFHMCWVFFFWATNANKKKNIILSRRRTKLARHTSGNRAGNPQNSLQMLQLIVSHTHDVCEHDTHKSTCLTQRKQKGNEFMGCFSFTHHTHVSLLSICMHGTSTKSSNSYIWCLLLLRACHNAVPSVWTRAGSFERILQTAQTYILEEMDRTGL